MRSTHQPKEHTTAKEDGEGDVLFCLRGHIKLLPQYGKSSKMANLWEGSGQVLVDGNGAPYASWKLYAYDTGSTTPKATYSDAGLTSANTSPVVADSNGRMGDVYLLAGRYKLVFKTSADVTIKTIDPYDSSQEMVTSTAAPSPAYPFMEYHNSTDGHRYRRNAANSAWIDLGLVDSLGNAATVTQQLAGTATDVFSTPDSVASLWQRGTDIASATTLSLPSTGGTVFNVTGTTTINGIGSAAGGRSLKLKFVGALTLTHNATSFILPGAANITTVAGDMAEFINEAAADSTGANWRCFNYQRASGSPINVTDQLGSQSDAETPASTTKTLAIANMKYHPLIAKAWVNVNASTGVPTVRGTAQNVTSFTDNGVGDYTVNFTTSFSAAEYAFSGLTGHATATSTNACTMNQGGAAPTASTFRCRTNDLTGAAQTDATWSSVMFFGDFA